MVHNRSADNPGMSSTISIRRLARASVSVLLLAACPAPSRAGQRVWVFQPPSQVVAIDAADYSKGPVVTIPREAYDHRQPIGINAHDQMLVALPSRRLWLWTGARAETLSSDPRLAHQPGPPGAHGRPATTWLLGADGRSLFCKQDDAWTVAHADGGGDSLYALRTRIVRTDLSGRVVETALDHTFPPCDCATAVCSETCPVALLDVPGNVIGGSFVFSHFIEGQTDATMGPSTLYRRGVNGWAASAIHQAFDESVLLPSGDGLLIENDGGCCGDVNGSSDRASWRGADSASTLYDEWTEFHNSSYQVTFAVARACLAPGGGRAALTIQSTQPVAGPIELSEDGQDDAKTLAAIRRSLAELPVVEVYATGHHPTPIRRLTHVALAEWISADEILVVDNGRLVAIDVTTGRRRESTIQVRGADDVIVPVAEAN
jgi:hypothetical protein